MCFEPSFRAFLWLLRLGIWGQGLFRPLTFKVVLSRLKQTSERKKQEKTGKKKGKKEKKEKKQQQHNMPTTINSRKGKKAISKEKKRMEKTS